MDLLEGHLAVKVLTRHTPQEILMAVQRVPQDMVEEVVPENPLEEVGEPQEDSTHMDAKYPII